jgi:hypothetical protein
MRGRQAARSSASGESGGARWTDWYACGRAEAAVDKSGARSCAARKGGSGGRGCKLGSVPWSSSSWGGRRGEKDDGNLSGPDHDSKRPIS